MILNPADRPFGRSGNPCGTRPRRANIIDAKQDWLNSVSVVVEELKGMKLSPAAGAYLGAMRQAYAEYGIEGVKVQLLYLWGNIRATTPRLKELKAEIKRLAANVPNPGREFHRQKALDYHVRARALRDSDPSGAAEAQAVAESEKENWEKSRGRRRNPHMEIERRQTVYHSPEWEALVEAGWTTWTVEEWDGQRIANMIRQTRRNPGRAWHQGAAREYGRKLKADEAAGHGEAGEYWAGALAAESKALAVENPGARSPAPVGRGGCMKGSVTQVSCPRKATRARRGAGGRVIRLCEKCDKAFGHIVGDPVEMNPRGMPSAAWMAKFWKAWARRNGVEKHQLEASDQARIQSQAAALHNVGFGTDRAAWMATPMTGEPGWRAKGPEVKKNPAGYLDFHGSEPDRAYKVQVPDGWPRKLWALGSLHKLVTERGVLHGGHVAAGRGDTVYILHASGRAGGRVKQIEYVPPGASKRAGATYYHPFKHPPVLVAHGHGCYTLRGRRVKVSPRGILG